MEEKKERQRKILPPLEELIGGSTSDLVSEALKKVIPHPPAKEEPKSEPPPTLTSTEPQSIEAEQKQKKKVREGNYTRLPYNLVADTPVPHSPSYSIAERHTSPVTTYPRTTYLTIPQLLLDEVLPTLNPYEQVLLVRLYRLSYGFRRNITNHVGKKRLADECNISVAMVKKVLKSLEGRGLIEKILDRSNHPSKGNKYRVLTRLLEDSVLAELCGKKA